MKELSDLELAGVSGGKFTPGQIKTIEHKATSFAARKLGGGPVFTGDVTNSVHQPTFISKGANRGVLVSTGDEANTQFYVGRALLQSFKNGIAKFSGLKDL